MQNLAMGAEEAPGEMGRLSSLSPPEAPLELKNQLQPETGLGRAAIRSCGPGR